MSDKIGRKPIVMFSWIGIAICFLFAPFSIKAFHGSLRDRPYLLVLGGFFQVFGGGVPVLMSTLYSIAADVSTEENKYVNANVLYNLPLTNMQVKALFVVCLWCRGRRY
jgi:MFS family permease